MVEDVRFTITIDEKKTKKEKTPEQKALAAKKKKERAIKKQSKDIGGGVSKAGNIASNPLGFLAGGAIGSITKLIPHVAIAGIALSVFDMFKKELLRDGSILDRRLKIYVERQVNVFRDRQLTRDLRTGRRVLRVTVSPGLRGIEGTIHSNLNDVRSGRGIQVDHHTQFATKGVIP